MSPNLGRVFRWYIVILLFLASVLGYMDRLVIGFLIDPIKHDLGISDLQSGMLTGLSFSLFYVTMGMPIGRLIDTQPKNIILSICIAIWSAMTVLSGLAQSFLTLFLARCGVGAGEAGLNPSAISIMGDTFPPDRLPWAVSIYNLGLWIGGGLAIILGGQLVAYFASQPEFVIPNFGVVESWRLVMVSVGIPGLFLALLIAFTMKPPRSTGTSEPVYVEKLSTVLEFYKSEFSAITLIVAGYSSFLFVAYSLLAWAPAMLMRTYFVSQSDVSLSYGIPYLVAGIAGALMTPSIIAMVRKRYPVDAPLAVGKWCMIVGVVPGVLAPIMPSAVLCIAGLTLTVFIWAVTASALMTTLTMAFPRSMRGLLWAAQTLITNFTAATFGPMIVGALSDNVFGPTRLGYGISLESLLAFPTAALLFHLAQPRFRDLVIRLSAGSPASAPLRGWSESLAGAPAQAS